jgi:hypothetical protein
MTAVGLLALWTERDRRYLTRRQSLTPSEASAIAIYRLAEAERLRDPQHRLHARAVLRSWKPRTGAG